MTCKACSATKGASEFYPGNRTTCKECISARNRARYEADPKKFRAKTAAWQAANREKYRDSQIKSKYGITAEAADAMLQGQGGRCAICRTDDPGIKGWQIDHDHDTLVVRGILCRHCNVALGHFRDNVTSLTAAIGYIERSRW
ncbi:endonuclease VII domain-containing protein [Arthrobacter sp. NA-172]|uniref:endonuclease VII domain-containing protein n=1 Tax=Arthrobacter sp. NA-172 TaxID=3367524 RepID=UPI003753F4CE